jgi:hypothetical protein
MFLAGEMTRGVVAVCVGRTVVDGTLGLGVVFTDREV